MGTGRAVIAALGLLTAGLVDGPAYAAVSSQDGFAADGTPQLHFDLAPYVWLPASSGQIILGNGAQVDIDTGIPTVSELSSTLQSAFMGIGLVRYGRWSGVLDIQYVSVSQNTGLPALAPGVTRNIDLDVNEVRIAPGVGYQLYNGNMGTSPATLDGRVGFSWMQTEISKAQSDRSGGNYPHTRTEP